MFRNDDTNFSRIDALERLKTEVEGLATECFIEVRLIGGLLKFTPRGVYTKLLLVLEQADCQDAVVINLHRSSELTSEHKGKAVSTSWVLGFLEHNASVAKEAVQCEEKHQYDADRKKMELERASRTLPCSPRVKCKACEGEGRWQAGDPSYGDAHFEYCSVCHGAGYVDV